MLDWIDPPRTPYFPAPLLTRLATAEEIAGAIQNSGPHSAGQQQPSTWRHVCTFQYEPRHIASAGCA